VEELEKISQRKQNWMNSYFKKPKRAKYVSAEMMEGKEKEVVVWWWWLWWWWW
jgi:hypothetical protein